MNAFSAEKWEKLFHNFGPFIQGFGTTLYIVIIGLILSLALGVIFGVLSTSHNRILRGIARVYVEFFQNTPLLVQVFFMYNAFPYMGITIPVKTIGIIGVGIYHGAYVSGRFLCLQYTGIRTCLSGSRRFILYHLFSACQIIGISGEKVWSNPAS